MKRPLVLLLSFILTGFLSAAQPNYVELPIKFVAGYGPLSPALRGPFWQHDSEKDQTWAKTFPTLRGLPGNWQALQQGYAPLDINQFVYQHAKAGTVPAYLYESYKKGLDWPADTTTLSAKPIRCFVNLSDSLTVAYRMRGRGKLSYSLMSKPGEFVRIQGVGYQYVGVDLASGVVRLKRMAADDSLYSTQPHYKAYPFSATEFTSQQPLSLANYRGKYILLDFWGTWCAPCRAQMPYLKEAYAKTSREKLEIIGIVANDTPGKLREYLDKESIAWPQIMADDLNNIIKTYQIESYPTTILIDPQGRVLTKGSRSGKNMVDLLSQLGQDKH